MFLYFNGLSTCVPQCVQETIYRSHKYHKSHWSTKMKPDFFIRLTWYFLFLDYSQFLTDPVWPWPFYKHLCNSFIHSFMECSFSSRSSRNHKSQIIRAREMNFWENVHPPLYVTCHKLHGLCQVSGVTYHFFFSFLYIVVALVIGGSVTNGAYPI